MPTVRFPGLQETLELHRQLIRRFGGAPGVRDMGLLESALVRPQTGYYDTLSLQAAALLQSLCQNHCFVDGNKRVAFACTAIFLRMNGFQLKLSASAGETFMIDQVIGKQVSIEHIRAWLERYMQPIRG